MDKPNTPDVREEVNDGEPKNQYLRPIQPREEKDVEKRSTSFTSFTRDENRRLTQEEAIEVQKLISEGTSPGMARAIVLGEEEEEIGF
jgi:hypothetical protein